MEIKEKKIEVFSNSSIELPDEKVLKQLLESIQEYGRVQLAKNGSKIRIKKKNRGKFTDYCGGNVTSECIQRGKNSSDPAVRKRATFAANARKWKH